MKSASPLGESFDFLTWFEYAPEHAVSAVPVDGYALIFASLLMWAGALGDRFGAKGAFMWGLLVFALASAASANSACHRWIACRQRGSRVRSE